MFGDHLFKLLEEPSYKASKINFTNVKLETFWLFKAKHGKKLLVVATDLQKFQKLN